MRGLVHMKLVNAMTRCSPAVNCTGSHSFDWHPLASGSCSVPEYDISGGEKKAGSSFIAI